jgi:hypothetical protein
LSLDFFSILPPTDAFDDKEIRAAATDVRKELEKRTWLKLMDSPEKADAVLAIAESQSTKRFPIPTQETNVSANLNKGDSVLWSDSVSFGEGAFNSGAGSAVKILLSHLNREAGGCKR